MFYFDKKVNRYRNSDGRFISFETIREEIDKLSLYVKNELNIISSKYLANKITLDEWEYQIREILKYSHVISSSIGYGGRNNMTYSELGSLGVILREQYKYLRNFKSKIGNKQIDNTQISYRSSLYAFPILSTFYLFQLKLFNGNPNVEVKRQRHASESCGDCIDWESRGFMPVDKMAPIGSLKCGPFCKCKFIYRATSWLSYNKK